jgi:hypothetical protein
MSENALTAIDLCLNTYGIKITGGYITSIVSAIAICV